MHYCFQMKAMARLFSSGFKPFYNPLYLDPNPSFGYNPMTWNRISSMHAIETGYCM